MLMAGPQTYWGYWINVLQDMRVKLEQIDKRLKAVEEQARQAPRVVERVSEAPQRGAGAQPAASAASAGQALSEKELTGCMALKELGKPSSIEDINEYLKKTRRIDESVKETLFMRLRGAIEKGYIGFDQKEKKFGLLKTSFVVE